METQAEGDGLIKERINELRSKLRRMDELRIELKALEKLRFRSLKPKRFGARRGVITILREAPRRQAEIVELLVGQIETRSANVKRILNTTIGQMRQEEKITERVDGRLELVEA